MGRYKWGYKSRNMSYKIVTLLRTLLIATHELPSRVAGLVLRLLVACSGTGYEGTPTLKVWDALVFTRL